MRISLLLQREPLDAILERTLASFWTAKLGKEVSACWTEGRPPVDHPTDEGQTWLVNTYLNAIFVPNANRAVFDPIRREFSRSTVWWRRPAQRAYVATALSDWGARWLAQARVDVAPPIPQAEQMLIIPGNHKIRLLDWHSHRSYGILKDGFRPVFMQRELAARRRATELGLSVPRLEMVAENDGWFVEEVISGTPSNRLARQEQVAQIEAEALRQLHILHEATRSTIPVGQYMSALQQQIRDLVTTNHLLTQADLEVIEAAVAALIRQAEANTDNEPINIAWTHGDFQPANILLGDDCIWLIDWEYAAQRQVDYDWLVYGLRSRFPDGLALRLRDFVAHGWPDGLNSVGRDWKASRWSAINLRSTCAAIFLLEELVLHLEENAQPAFTRLGDGLRTLLGQLMIWMRTGVQV